MNNKPIQILMVEDDIVDVMAFKRMVKREQLNYNYQITDSIETAKQLIKDNQFDIAVTDYQLILEKMGFDVISKLLVYIDNQVFVEEV